MQVFRYSVAGGDYRGRHAALSIVATRALRGSLPMSSCHPLCAAL